jgi:methyltransferase (TIGR00027 family)
MEMSKTSRRIFGAGLAAATALRATEAFRPANERIFDARFDYVLLPTFWRALLLPGIRPVLVALIEKFGMGTPGMLFCRTRFIDDALEEWLRNDKQQVICLGAGYDTRAYRIPGIERTRFFELDLPTAQSLKREHLHKVLGEIPAHVTFIPINFNHQSIEDEMAAAAYQPEIETFFIWEGVTQYITAEAVDATLKFAAQAEQESQIAFTYIDKRILEGTSRTRKDQRIMTRVARRGMPWVFGLYPAELESWLSGRGFKLIDHADAMEYRNRYVTPVGRELNIYEGERMVLAEVSG